MRVEREYPSVLFMAHEVIQICGELEHYKEEVARLEEIEKKYIKLLNESVAHAQIMSGQVLSLALARAKRATVYLVFKDDKMLEYVAPEIIFVYEDKEEADALVDLLNEEAQGDGTYVEYYVLPWEVRPKGYNMLDAIKDGE